MHATGQHVTTWTHHLILIGEREQRGEHGAEGEEEQLEEQEADRVLSIL